MFKRDHVGGCKSLCMTSSFPTVRGGGRYSVARNHGFERRNRGFGFKPKFEIFSFVSLVSFRLIFFFISFRWFRFGPIFFYFHFVSFVSVNFFFQFRFVGFVSVNFFFCFVSLVSFRSIFFLFRFVGFVSVQFFFQFRFGGFGETRNHVSICFDQQISLQTSPRTPPPCAKLWKKLKHKEEHL